ncbi:Histone-Lysine N-Methyltransferase ash1l [Geranomyces variabilis]|nr:Histone-Lysine N-Methyltransferase ash1l [Geranomyces variabilis]
MAVDGDEENEVTRCACGINESYGIMVMCEKCFVWQHCECMNVNDKRLPKHYYCEECKPKGHSYFQRGLPQRTTTRAPQIDANSPNRLGRNTMNSRETAQAFAEDSEPAFPESPESIDDASRSSQEFNGAGATLGRGMRRSSGSNKNDVALERKNIAGSRITEPEPQRPEVDAKPPKRKRAAVSSPQAKAGGIPAEGGRASKRRAGRNHEPLDSTAALAAATNFHEPTSSTREDIKDLSFPSPQAPSKSRKRKAAGGGTRKTSNTSSRSATAAAATISPSSTTGIPDTVVVLVPNAASPSPSHNYNHNDTAVKTRVPNAKSSFGEMNKRVKQMSDYITHLQVAMANYPSFLATTAAAADAGVGIGSAESNGEAANAYSVSPISVSTQSPAGSEPPQSSSSSFYNATTTAATAATPVLSARPQMFEMMDHLNLRLIRFQERYGSFSKR